MIVIGCHTSPSEKIKECTKVIYCVLIILRRVQYVPRATYALPGQGAPLSRIGGPSLGSTSRQSGIRVSQQYVDEKGKLHLDVEAVIREGLKVGTKKHYLDGIPALFSTSELFKSPDIKDEKFKSPSERVAIGLCQS